MADDATKVAQLLELQNHLDQASRSLTCAWRLQKRMGMEASAKETADAALDAKDAARLVMAQINDMGHN